MLCATNINWTRSHNLCYQWEIHYGKAESLEMNERSSHSSGPRKLTGAEIIWECLERLGVEHVFGYPGGAILPTYDALTKSKVHHVLVRHEQGATHMADGYARASGR